MSKYDAIVVGGGIIGCSVSYYLSKLGRKVLLLEQKDHAQGTAGATDGVVSYHTKKPGKQMDLAMQSLKLFEGLSDELGEDIEFIGGCGGMQPAEDKAQWDILSDIAQKQRGSGVDIRMIGIHEAREIEPLLAPDLYGALYAPSGSKIEPIRLTMAYLHAAKRLGADVRNHAQVTGFTKSGSRVTGVVMADDTHYKAGQVVIACGAWTAQVAMLADISVPIRPRKGQLLITEPIGHFMKVAMQCALYNVIKFMPEAVTDPSILRMGASLSIHQTRDGGLLIGGTREWADFDRLSTFEAVEAIARRALRFFPSLKDVSIIRSFAGLRPYTPDGMALIGATRQVPGLYFAAGHEGDGIALAPITGKLLAEEMTLGKASYPLDPFSPNRFITK